VINEGDVFSLRRDIVHYDMFYNNNNSWRMQGAKANFGLEFNGLIKSLDFKTFITRQRATDGILEPERLFGGGTIKLVQSDNLSLAFNTVNIFDLEGTIPDSIQYKNNVHTFNVNYSRDLNEKIKLAFKSEAGVSNARYINYADNRAPESMNDWFYDVAVVSNFKGKNTSISLGYKDVGADFLSPGAQTKRINYSKFPALYQQITNDAIGRQISYSDVISGNTENSFKISEELMPYYAAYNNSNPYGLATPNRKGVYAEFQRTDSVKFKNSFVKTALLTQSRGTGTTEKKNFFLIEAGTDVYLNDYLGWKKQIKLDLGLRYENTSRGGEVFEVVALSSTFVDLGLSYELVESFDILIGAKIWSVKGNEFNNDRNQFNNIVNFNVVNYGFNENTYAAGLRYRFSDKNILSAQYQINNIKHTTGVSPDYGISQFTFLYSLLF
jgi:hypothetical protein